MHKAGFLGKAALGRAQAAGERRVFVGFELARGPVPRLGYELSIGGRKVGTVTSGTFSPSLKKALGMGYVEPQAAQRGTTLQLMVRNQAHAATVVKLPFWTPPAGARRALGGQSVIQLQE